MTDFTATHFRFCVEAVTPLAFDDYTGSALRGAMVSALQRHFCPVQGQADEVHQAACPVCWLLTYEATAGDARRPYAIEPLLGRQRAFEPGQRFSFGITLYGHAVALFPYLVLAVTLMGREGVGKPTAASSPQGRPSRGRFSLCTIEEVNPLSGDRLPLMAEGGRVVDMPRRPVTEELVKRAAQRLERKIQTAGGRLGLRFLTPARIVDRGQLVRAPLFRPLFQRLLERVHELQATFGRGAEPPDWHTLRGLAERVTLVEDHTHWWDVKGHSQRLQREQNLGGYVGLARYQADTDVWRPLLPWLVWGMSTHVGKNAVKGSGWYTMVTGDR
ncbi:MAG: CRISPR system precrRNA processing endoribonuclease RAMP protein Cas6 [Caldilineales bacterium]|nr:CRISPR system precrRNA processing endoribonuclease RAMP protein Cas6 [Caldilineales bacterium]